MICLSLTACHVASKDGQSANTNTMTSTTNSATTIEQDPVIKKLKKLVYRREIVFAFPANEIHALAAATVGTQKGWQSRIARLVYAPRLEIVDAVNRARRNKPDAFVTGAPAVQLAMLRRRLELTQRAAA